MKFLILKKRAITAAAALMLTCAVLIASLSGSGAYAVYYGKPLRKLPVYRVERTEKIVALTFDAAYGSDKTEKIMEILMRSGFEATFFLVGFWMDNNPEVTKKIARNGFEIGTHSNTHSHMSKLSREQCQEDLRQSAAKIEQLTGVRPKLFRAPYGEYNNALLEAAESLSLMTVQWDVDSLDWMQKTTVQISQRVLDKVKEGSIVLFHNNADHILEVLPIVIDRLKMRGFKSVKLSDLLYFDNYYIDSQGSQHYKSA